MLKVFTNDYEWVVAKDLDDAFSVLEEVMGLTQDYLDEEEWHECHNLNVNFSIFNEDTNSTETLTLAEWINKSGRGYLATTEY